MKISEYSFFDDILLMLDSQADIEKENDKLKKYKERNDDVHCVLCCRKLNLKYRGKRRLRKTGFIC